MVNLTREFEKKADKTEVEDLKEEMKKYTKLYHFEELEKKVNLKALGADLELLKDKYDATASLVDKHTDNIKMLEQFKTNTS